MFEYFDLIGNIENHIVAHFMSLFQVNNLFAFKLLRAPRRDLKPTAGLGGKFRETKPK